MTKKLQIIFSYLFHIVLICLGFFLLEDYCDAFLYTAAVLFLAYLIFCIVLNRKSYIPRILFLHHVVGFAIEAILHLTKIIPPDSGFFRGFGQFIYLCSLPPYLALLAISNLILFLIFKKQDIYRSNSITKY